MDVLNVEKRLIERYSDVEAWIARHAESVCFPIYSSVDVRDSGHKISVVDANCFPAGFNNLCEAFLDRGGQLLKEFVTESFGSVERIAIYPESHTRNKFYIENILSLKSIVDRAGFDVRIATADPRFPDTMTELEGFDDRKAEVHKLVRNGATLRTDDFAPDLILINNDFSDGRPAELMNIAQPLTPPLEMGWYVRTKWEHFQIYESLVEEFADILEVDPWLLAPLTDFAGGISFKSGGGAEIAAAKVDALIERIAAKYGEYGIDNKPLVFVKDNTGTYGMGIIVVESGEQLLSLNRSQRNKMSRGKGSSDIESVIIQECIPTADYFEGHPGEPVVYMIADQVLGGFFRYGESRSVTESLNAPGAKFAQLCITEKDDFDEALACYHGHCAFELYYTIARIAGLAMGQEMKNRELCPEEITSSEVG